MAECPYCRELRGVSCSRSQAATNEPIEVYAIQCDHTWRLTFEDSKSYATKVCAEFPIIIWIDGSNFGGNSLSESCELADSRQIHSILFAEGAADLPILPLPHEISQELRLDFPLQIKPAAHRLFHSSERIPIFEALCSLRHCLAD